MIQYKQLKKGDPYVFFEQNLAVEILDVLEYDYNNIHNVGRRPFHALSYRFDADSTIISDRNKFQVKKGTLAYFPANCPYCRISKNEHLIAIHFTLFNHTDHGIEMITPKCTEKMEALFTEILHLQLEKRGAIYRRYEIFYEILRLASEEISEEKAIKDKTFSKIEKYIIENYRNVDLTVASLAKMAFMSEVTFRKHFQNYFQKSPKEYILEKRFAYAVALLKSGQLNISEIAALSGFSNEKHFSTLFKKKYGLPPSKYIWDFAPNSTKEIFEQVPLDKL